MNSVSKTGLIASPKKSIRKCHKPPDQLNLNGCAIARPAAFSLRPFGGLYNPYAKGCSILCNHPGPNEVKTVVRQAKDAWLHDSKIHGTAGSDAHPQAPSAYRCHVTGASEPDAGRGSSHADDDLPEHVPEEFFRRYTGSDSRPMTPTPTVASGRTRTSAGSGAPATGAPARRCFTPDPAGHSGAKARQQLILDLRRSHSQETLYWAAASSELTPTATGKAATATAKAATAGAGSPGAAGKSARSLRLCELEAKRRADAELEVAQQRAAEAEALRPPVAVCINALDEYDDGEDEGPRRRGKRKRKSNKPQSTATYKVSEEPETQIATLGPDSPNQSNRPSLVPNGANEPPAALRVGGGGAGGGSGGLAAEAEALAARAGGGRRSSFISEEAMKYLRRGLNVDVVEGAFERYMNRALLEALRTMPANHLGTPSEALRTYQAAHPIPPAQPLRWLSMPRKYPRKSVRFTLPINTYDLGWLTPLQYVARHVWLSECRKELCRCVFAKYQPEAEAAADADGGAVVNLVATDPWSERTLDCGAHLDAALGDVLGFYATGERIAGIRDMLGLIGINADDDGAGGGDGCRGVEMPAKMNFRSWCGVVAFGERYLNRLSRELDPCDEIEVVDFQSLERKFNNVAVNEPIRRLLTWIKYH